MGAFIGTLGSLIEATQWQEKQSVATGASPSFFTGLDGSRTAFVQPTTGRVSREWEISMSDADSESAAAFQALALGAYGNGPFLFVDPLAQVTNLLTPRQSLMDPDTLPTSVTQSRAVVPGLGSMPAARTKAADMARFSGSTPVLPGVPATVSAWVVSTATVTVTAQCMNAAGNWTSNNVKTFSGLSSGGWVSVTVVPSDTAAQVDMRVTSNAQDTVACPAVTWTEERVPWSPGRGARSVMVHGLSEEFLWASPEKCGQRRVDYSATVTEVGSGA